MIDTGNLAELISAISGCVTGAAGTIVAVFLYRLNRQQQKEAWVKTHKEINEAFWNDPVMAKVRCWITYERGFQQIKPVLQKRRRIDEKACSPDELTESEYQHLDELDKFYALALRVAALTAESKMGREQIHWQRLSVDFLVTYCLKEGREELKWYVERFFPGLLQTEVLDKFLKDLKEGKHIWWSLKEVAGQSEVT